MLSKANMITFQKVLKNYEQYNRLRRPEGDRVIRFFMQTQVNPQENPDRRQLDKNITQCKEGDQ